jgi:hypothetical protein
VSTVLSLIALAVLPAAALAASTDAATSEAYVRANYALVSAGHAKLASSNAALQSLLRRVRRECPMIAAGSPENEQSEKLTWQLAATMRIIVFRGLSRPIAQFAQTARRLRWSNSQLNGSIHEYARRLSAEATAPAPDLCADLRTWKASGYTQLPSHTLPFVNAYYPVEAIGWLPKRQLTRYLPSSQNGLLQRSLRLQGDLLDFEANAVETWGSIMDAVELKE